MGVAIIKIFLRFCTAYFLKRQKIRIQKLFWGFLRLGLWRRRLVVQCVCMGMLVILKCGWIELNWMDVVMMMLISGGSKKNSIEQWKILLSLEMEIKKWEENERRGYHTRKRREMRIGRGGQCKRQWVTHDTSLFGFFLHQNRSEFISHVSHPSNATLQVTSTGIVYSNHNTTIK